MNKAQRAYSSTVLVALLNKVADYDLARVDGWYRIPVDTAPLLVREGRVKMLAFYHTSAFEKYKYSIRFVAKVKSIEIVPRRMLFPSETIGPKSDKLYYRLAISDLEPLEKPISSQKKRRILFITTSFKRLTEAADINDLFDGTPVIEQVWSVLKINNIAAERYYPLKVKNRDLILDFAIFCRKGNIVIKLNNAETEDEISVSDLENLGWTVLKLPTNLTKQDLETNINDLMDKIAYYGGIG